jgi:hypothetical protein
MRALLRVIGVRPNGVLICKNDEDQINVYLGITNMDRGRWARQPSLIVGAKVLVETPSSASEVEAGNIRQPKFISIYEGPIEKEEEDKMKFIAEVVDKLRSSPFCPSYKLVEIEAEDKEAARKECIQLYGSPRRLFEAEEVEARSETDSALEAIHTSLRGTIQNMRPLVEQIRDVSMRAEMSDEYVYSLRDAHRDIMNAMDRIRRAGRALRKKESDR